MKRASRGFPAAARHASSLLKAIEAIYSTVEDPQQWSSALPFITGLLGGDAAALFHLHPANGAAGLPEIEIGGAAAHAAEVLCVLNPLLAVPDDPAELPKNITDLLCPTESILRTSFFQGDPAAVAAHSLTMTLRADRAFVGRLRFCRARDLPPFRKAERELAEKLLPHLQRAVRLRMQLVDFASSAGSAERALDYMPQAIFLLDPSRRVLYANRQARAAADAEDGIAVHHGRLHLQDAKTRNAFTELLQRTATDRSGGALRIGRRSENKAYTLVIAPFQADAARDDEGSSTIIAVFSDPDMQVGPSADLLARLYRLTAAEVRLAQALVTGSSLEEAAASFRVTLETVRSQLKSIFSKTNTRRQSELVRVLLGSALDLQKRRA